MTKNTNENMSTKMTITNGELASYVQATLTAEEGDCAWPICFVREFVRVPHGEWSYCPEAPADGVPCIWLAEPPQYYADTPNPSPDDEEAIAEIVKLHGAQLREELRAAIDEAETADEVQS